MRSRPCPGRRGCRGSRGRPARRGFRWRRACRGCWSCTARRPAAWQTEQSTWSATVVQGRSSEGEQSLWHWTQATRAWRECSSSSGSTWSFGALDAARRLQVVPGVAAHAVAVGHSLRVERLADLVGRVAVDAGRDHVRLLLPQLAPDHLAVHPLDLGVALRAGLDDLLLGDGGAGVGVRQHVVRRVAARADRRDDQPLLVQPSPWMLSL